MKKNKIIYLVLLSLLSVTITSCKKDNASIGGFDENGASNAHFSVSLTKQVRFSKGNLQYKASTDTWRFAENQYDYIGTDNENISSSYNGWIDLFGWGTSGWNSGAVCYQPWSTSTERDDYYLDGNSRNCLAGSYSKADWGVNNRISNGGNQSGMWRTLTYEEWDFLLFKSGKRVRKWAKATIDGTIKGLVILPDDWVLPDGVTYTSGDDGGYNTNQYSLSQWSIMEGAGAIFIPAGGLRVGSEMDNTYSVGTFGTCWSSTASDSSVPGDPYAMRFDGDMLYTGNAPGYTGRFVRLVQDAE